MVKAIRGAFPIRPRDCSAYEPSLPHRQATNLFAKANALRCPVLVFRGGVSTRFPEALEHSFCEAFPSRPKLVVCPKSGHFPIAIELEIVVTELKRFLDNVC